MKKWILGGASLVCALLMSGVAQAGPVYDFSTLTAGFDSNTSETLGPVTASGFYDSSGTWTATNLYVRNDAPNDLGLGVCSEGQTSCDTSGGDVNELSQLTNSEALMLSLESGHDWSGLWVSSLDPNGTSGGPEAGTICWGNSTDIATLLGGDCASFQYGDFGTSVNGDVLTLAALSGFDPTARHVVFLPGGNLGNNNDYLVWGASVPEPASLLLFGAGLAVMASRLRRRRLARA